MKYILFLLALLFPVSLAAQATEGSVLGIVVDPSGRALVGAQIVVTNTQTNFPRTTVTNGSGEYLIANLPVGIYSVSAEISGFKTDIESPVELTVKARVRVDFKMQTGSVNQSVEVTSSAPLLKTDTTEVSTLITRKELESLPSLDRNFLSLQVLTPGTYRPWPNAGGDRIGDFSGGESMQVNGVDPGQNNFILDGISNNVALTGGMNSVPPMDAIQEFAVQTNGYSAEFGRAGGGIVNVALRSGTNEFHGYAYDYIQNDV
ncbi:MAG TPA: TonB-dependent receptor, partial [Acidobacteriaceae bacterium]|nr:TonB-dependent receptor [Acidobacteriaceae bacterium]